MFQNDLFAYLLELLAQEITARPTPAPNPLPVDSYIARSVMQKAIRRGMTTLALRAAAQFMVLDARVLWRRLLVTALEASAQVKPISCRASPPHTGSEHGGSARAATGVWPRS